jgi:hypothetical protein
MSTSTRSAGRPSGSSHQRTVNQDTTAKKASDTVYTFSFTTLWFHTVNAVAPRTAAITDASVCVHRGEIHAASTRSATRYQRAAEAALHTAARALIRSATDPAGTSDATRPSSTKSGLPGGCGIPSVYAAVMYSLASHIAVVGASVSAYSANTPHPTIAALP